MLTGSLSDWPRFFDQALKHLKPGGWFELQEFESWIYSDDDPELTKAPTLKRYMEIANQTATEIGKGINIAYHVNQGLINAGFEDVREEVYKVPFGTWAKGKNTKFLGSIMLDVVTESLDAYGFTLMTRVRGMSAQESRELHAQAEAEFRDKSNHFFGRFRFIYGRKPVTTT